jgi:hypothetical protein
MRGNLDSPSSRVAHAADPRLSTDLFHNHNHYSECFNLFSKTIKLVVVMSTVELWKAQQLLSSYYSSGPSLEWWIVGIDEN